jgi:hypothetical protein
LKSLPKTLDETYARILCNIDVEYRTKVIAALQWITYSRRPLRVEELEEAVVIDPAANPAFNPAERLRKGWLVQILSSLVVVSKQSDQRTFSERLFGRADEIEEIRIAHFSVKEYLESPRVLGEYLESLQVLGGPKSGFPITEQESNRVITESSLLYIKSYALSDNKSSSQQDLERFPLLQYTCRFWSNHADAMKEATDPDINNLIFKFLSSDVERSSWLRIYHPDKIWTLLSQMKDTILQPPYITLHT